MVHTHHGAMFGQTLRVELLGALRRILQVEQRHTVVLGLGHASEGLRPVLRVDHDGQHLGRKERPVVHRHDVQLVRQHLALQHHAGVGRAVVVDDLVRNVLLAHEGAPAPSGDLSLDGAGRRSFQATSRPGGTAGGRD
ncbi:hypothetical protein D9M71_348660 [compost metagenome]